MYDRPPFDPGAIVLDPEIRAEDRQVLVDTANREAAVMYTQQVPAQSSQLIPVHALVRFRESLPPPRAAPLRQFGHPCLGN